MFQVYPHDVTNGLLKKPLFSIVTLRVQSYFHFCLTYISDMLHTELKPDPLLIMLGVSDQFSQLNKCQQLSHAFIWAKELVLMFWKKTGVPPG